MNILMMTNTYLPHVGGVARSVHAFSEQYRRMGHQVMVVAPEFEGMPDGEAYVVRIPAIQHFNGSDFSVVLPVSGFLHKTVKHFKPDIIHSHHPFLMGSTALRIANLHRLPHVFTHHTMYERYTHYVPGDSLTLKKFVVELATHYANLCEQVFVPSESIAEVLQARKVETAITVIPTGVDLEHYREGSGSGFRQVMGIPEKAFVVGHLGRLAAEKNLPYLAEAVALFLQNTPHAHALIAGKGPAEQQIKAIFREKGVLNRLTLVGLLEGPMLASAYKAMDIFAFASHSETQGMVLTEAMASGVPVLALDAAGVREVLHDGQNGRLLFNASIEEFSMALREYESMSEKQQQQYQQTALATADVFSLENSAKKALSTYQALIDQDHKHQRGHEDLWSGLLPLIEAEWNLLKSYTESAGSAIFKHDNIKEEIKEV